MGILNENSLVKIRLTIYGLLVILSFFIFVGVAVMMENAEICPLFPDIGIGIHYNGPGSNCRYPIVVSVVFQLIFLLLRLGSLILVTIGKLSKDSFLFWDLFEFLYVLIDLIAFFLTFVGACILTDGSREALNHRYNFDWEAPSEVAQAGAWASAILWLIVGLLGLKVIWTSGKIPFIGNKSQDSSSSQFGKGQGQREMVDPASETFRV